MASAEVDVAPGSNAASDDEDFSGAVNRVESDEDDAGGDAGDDLGDDLFGDDDGGIDGEAEEQPQQRMLDDEDLDSGDDDGRADRAGDSQTQPQMEEAEYNFMDADIARHPIPEPSDGELYLLKIPPFLAVEPAAFNFKTFQPPITDHHSKSAASEHFSAFNTATTTVRWRRSPSDHTKLQSNARILRWSDGSLTLQIANEPLSQYEINASMLAPPQINPKHPTPLSRKGRRKDEGKESYTYLVAPYEEANVMRVTNKFTTGLSVVPTANTKDAALEKLQNDLARAAVRGRDSANQAISFIDVNEDPELRRQREEQHFKEKMKQQKAREKNAQREQERTNRVMHRGGAQRAGYGLDIGMLEGEEGGRKGGSKKPRAKARHRDWSDDEEDYGRGRNTKEDEYDDEDDFIAPSDDEPEIVEDDDDDDDGILDDPKSPKRSRGRDDEDEEVRVRPKKRRVVDDDEDDE